MKYFRIHLTILIGLISLNVSSQTPWSLSDCIKYAQENNIQLKRVELQSTLSQKDYKQSKLDLLPNISANAARNYTWGSYAAIIGNEVVTTDVSSYNDSYSVSSGMQLFSGLQGYNSIKAAEYTMLAQIQNVEKEKIQITLDISAAYLQILFARELLEVNKRQLEVTTQQVEKKQKLVDAGSVSRGELLEIKAQLASEKLNVSNAQNNLDLAYLNLTQILDLETPEGFEVVFPDSARTDIMVEIPSPETVYTDATNYLPHFKSSEYQVKAAESNLKIQKGSLSPTVSTYGSWGTGFSSIRSSEFNYNEQLDNNNQFGLGVRISIPIFSNWQKMNQISTARINLEDTKYINEQLHQQLFKQIQQAYNDAISSREQYVAANEAVVSNQEAFEYTRQKYEAGIVTTVEYNVAKTNFTKAESDFARAKYNFIFSLKILEFYRGVPITL